MSWSKVIASMKRHINAFESKKKTLIRKDREFSYLLTLCVTQLFWQSTIKYSLKGDDRKHRYFVSTKDRARY